MTIYCKNTRCRHCFIDTKLEGQLVCTGTPELIKIKDARVFVLKCNTYKKRPAGVVLRPIISSIGPDGLYKGQIKAPIDMSDYDSEDLTGPTLDGLDSLKDCKT